MIILDRFEGNYAVIEIDGEIVNVERYFVDTEVNEGDVLLIKEDIYYKDHKSTEKRKQSISDRFKDMWED